MRPLSLFSAAFAAGVALASPAVIDNSKRAAAVVDDDIVEHVVFKRGDVPSPRDLQQADELGVNLEEMFKHSLLKRSNGEETTIWVHNSWQEDPAPVEKRQQQLHTWASRFHSGSRIQCQPSSQYWGRSTANSPFSGGVDNLMRWAWGTNGHFNLPGGCCRTVGDIVISGSNSGANAAFAVRTDDAARFLVGTYDIAAEVAHIDARYKAQDSRGSWRVEGGTTVRCNLAGQPFITPVEFVLRHTTKRAGN